MKRVSPLKKECADIIMKLGRIRKRMEKDEKNFWANGGICCPFCGVYGHSERATQCDQLEKRLKELEQKLKQDTSGKKLVKVVIPNPNKKPEKGRRSDNPTFFERYLGNTTRNPDGIVSTQEKPIQP